MKILKQVGIVLGICLVAEFLTSLLPFAFPSSVIAIMVLAFLLFGKVMKEEQIQETADFFLTNMALVFVPITVGIIEELGVLKNQVVGFIIVAVVSLVITFLGTYVSVWLIQIALRAYRKGASHE